jgi:two-component system copper resistance phosphate regulon response regulator CusR
VTILLVEDEERVASFVVKGLEAHGYPVEHVATGAEALARIRAGEPDLILLDLTLPDLDGLEILRRLREDGIAVPVIILTARGDVDDRVQGFDVGADDYLTKPFAFDELVARLRARLRPRPMSDSGVLRAGNVVLDLNRRRVEVEGREVALAAREFELLETFLCHPGEVLSRTQLLTRVWGPKTELDSNVIEVYVGYLRRKLGAGCIETVRGLGYRLPD